MTALWDPRELAAKLGITLPAATDPSTNGHAAGAVAEPVDLDEYPTVKAALDIVSAPPDRSADTMRVVAACADAFLTLPQARWAVMQRADLTQRLGERKDDDVLVCWLKTIDRRQQQVRDTSWAHLSGGAASSTPAGEESPPKTPVLADKLLTRSALRDLPDPESLIDNTLDKGTVALLYGKWSTCKSFIAQDWGASIATGRDWQGRRTEQGRVLYIAAEGAYGLKARIDAWEQGWRHRIADGALDVLPVPVNLSRPAEVVQLAALIAWNGYVFVVIDTLARSMVGADENSAGDCGEIVDALHRLRAHTPGGRGVILGVHHTGKDGKTFRGSSVFEAGADTVYSSTRDDAVIVLDREKRKDGPAADRHRLRLSRVEGTDSCVVENVPTGVGNESHADSLLSHFESHFSETGASGPQLRDSSGMPNSSFYRALNELLKDKKLVKHGIDSRPYYRLPGKW